MSDGNGLSDSYAWRARLPRLVGQGRRASVAALVERITAQLADEVGGGAAARLPEMTTATQRLQLLLPVVDYVLAVESIRLTPEEKADVVEAVYSAVFGYGGLDALLIDDALTTVLLDGPAHVAVRAGHSMLQEVTPLFEGRSAMAEVVERMLADGHLTDGLAGLLMAEFGLVLGPRRAGVNITVQADGALRVDVRLHPPTPVPLEAWGGGALAGDVLTLLHALAASEHGVLVAGAAETGKTTLLGALAAGLATSGAVASVERADELVLPPDVARYGAPMRWDATNPDAPDTFAEGVVRALAAGPAVLLLDEMRDDPAVMRALLDADPGPRLMVAMRATSDPARVTAALSLVARRALPGAPEGAAVARWFARVPFALVVRRTQDALRLQRVVAWGWHDGYPQPVVLVEVGDDGPVFTGKAAPVPLPGLPTDFWRARRA